MRCYKKTLTQAMLKFVLLSMPTYAVAELTTDLYGLSNVLQVYCGLVLRHDSF
jgi:hypothetical protein